MSSQEINENLTKVEEHELAVHPKKIEEVNSNFFLILF